MEILCLGGRWPDLVGWGRHGGVDIVLVLTLLPLLCLILLYVLFLPAGGITAHPRRLALLHASLAWGILMATSTEALGFFHALTRPAVATLWGGAAVLLAAAVAVRHRPWTGDLLPSVRGVDPVVRVCLAGCAVVAAITAFIALAAAPNTWDSMTYHLTRVMHWEQDRSLDFYATNIQRQLHLTPGAEYVTLHLHLLSGGDRLANLPQWFASMGSLFVVSLIAARLGATARGQALAALFCATLPMGILQSTSTQTDFVVAYWLACLVALVTDATTRTWPWMLALGAALGLATLTKATAFVSPCRSSSGSPCACGPVWRNWPRSRSSLAWSCSGSTAVSSPATTICTAPPSARTERATGRRSKFSTGTSAGRRLPPMPCATRPCRCPRR